MVENSSNNRLIALAELLFMPMLFYVLTRWSEIDTWQGKVLWFAVFALIQNEFLSVRESYPFYNIKLYLLDLISVIVYVISIDLLTKTNSIIGYNPLFWVLISILWLGYGLWDFLMLSQETVPEKKEKFKQWGRTMLLFFFITLLCGLGLLSTVNQPTLPDNKYLIYILQFIPFCFVVWAVALWLKDLDSLLSKK